MKKITLILTMLFLAIASLYGQNPWVHTYIKVNTSWDSNKSTLDFFSCIKSDSVTNGSSFDIDSVIYDLKINNISLQHTLETSSSYPIPTTGIINFSFSATNPVTGNVYQYNANIDVNYLTPSITYNQTPVTPHNLPLSLLITNKVSTGCNGEVNLNISGGYPYTSSANPYGISWEKNSTLVNAYHEDSLTLICNGTINYKFRDNWSCDDDMDTCITVETYYDYMDTTSQSLVSLANNYPYIDSSFIVNTIIDTNYNSCSTFNCANSFFCDEEIIEELTCNNLNLNAQLGTQSCLYNLVGSQVNNVDTYILNNTTSQFMNFNDGINLTSSNSNNLELIHKSGVSLYCSLGTISSVSSQVNLDTITNSDCDSINGKITFNYQGPDLFNLGTPLIFFEEVPSNLTVYDSSNNIVWNGQGYLFSNHEINNLSPGSYTINSDSYSCPILNSTQGFIILEDTTNCNTCTADASFSFNEAIITLPLSYDFQALDTNNNCLYFWDFGDGSTSNSAFETHTYSFSGTYDVCLTVTTCDTVPCYDTICQTITVVDSDSCNISASYDWYQAYDSTNGLWTNTIYIVNQSVGNNLSYNWDFNNGSYSYEENPTTTLPGNSYYHYVCLDIYSTDSCEASFCDSIIPQGNFSNYNILALVGYTGINQIESSSIVVDNIYPNPTSDNSFINLNSINNSTITINIVTLSGELISRELRSLSIGENNLQLNTQNLTSGIYFVSLIDEKGFDTNLKLIKK